MVLHNIHHGQLDDIFNGHFEPELVAVQWSIIIHHGPCRKLIPERDLALLSDQVERIPDLTNYIHIISYLVKQEKTRSLVYFNYKRSFIC